MEHSRGRFAIKNRIQFGAALGTCFYVMQNMYRRRGKETVVLEPGSKDVIQAKLGDINGLMMLVDSEGADTEPFYVQTTIVQGNQNNRLAIQGESDPEHPDRPKRVRNSFQSNCRVGVGVAKGVSVIEAKKANGNTEEYFELAMENRSLTRIWGVGIFGPRRYMKGRFQHNLAFETIKEDSCKGMLEELHGLSRPIPTFKGARFLRMVRDDENVPSFQVEGKKMTVVDLPIYIGRKSLVDKEGALKDPSLLEAVAARCDELLACADGALYFWCPTEVMRLAGHNFGDIHRSGVTDNSWHIRHNVMNPPKPSEDMEEILQEVQTESAPVAEEELAAAGA